MLRRKQTLLLSGVLLVLLVVLYFEYRPQEAGPALAANSTDFQPLSVENPSLRLDLLDRLKKFQYQGSHRNIFVASIPPPPAAAPVQAAAAKPAPPPLPPGPPPLTIPATFFGYVTDPSSGARRAFFNDGDNVYVVAVGETLLGRYRLLQIGNNTAQVEEMATGRTATVTMVEELGAS